MVDLFALRGSGRRGTSCHVMQIIADTHKNCWPSFAVFSGETRWETNRQKTSGTVIVQAGSTDEPHPHVHMVLKAMTEGWEYHLNIPKPMLRKWRKAFAHHLCALDVQAKATRRIASREYLSAGTKDYDIHAPRVVTRLPAPGSPQRAYWGCEKSRRIFPPLWRCSSASLILAIG
jgi:hypothetical protein